MSLPLFPISRNGIKPQLEAALVERGWEVVAKSQVDDNLWWDELWILESRWSPAVRRVYLAFEFDDVTESVAAATREPVDHHDTDWRTRLELDKNWSSEFDRFLAEIDELRQQRGDE